MVGSRNGLKGRESDVGAAFALIEKIIGGLERPFAAAQGCRECGALIRLVVGEPFDDVVAETQGQSYAFETLVSTSRVCYAFVSAQPPRGVTRMKVHHLLSLIVVCGCVLANASETDALPTTLSVDGTTYQDVRWGNVTPASVTIYHSTGVASIPLEKLSPQIQKQLGYDSAKAIEHRKQEAAAREQFVARQRESQLRAKWANRKLRRIGGQIYDFTEVFEAIDKKVEHDRAMPQQPERPPDRSKLGARTMYENQVARYNQWNTEAKQIDERFLAASKYVIQGTVTQVLPSGLLLKVTTIRDVFLVNYLVQNRVVEGTPVAAAALPVGTYTYTTVMGASRTIEKFDCGQPVINPGDAPVQRIPFN